MLLNPYTITKGKQCISSLSIDNPKIWIAPSFLHENCCSLSSMREGWVYTMHGSNRYLFLPILFYLPTISFPHFAPQSTIQLLNPIQDGVAKKPLPRTSFSPVTPTNVGISPQNFLTFNFNPFDMLL